MFIGSALMRTAASASSASMNATPRPATRSPGHPEEHRDTRVDCVHAMAEAWQPPLRAGGLRHDAGGSLLRRKAVARGHLQACRDELHAGRAGAAVVVADRQHTGRNRGRYRLAVPGRDEARRCARGRPRAVVRHADQYRVEQPPFARRREAPEQQEHDDVGESRLAHQVRDAAPADPDVRGVRVDDGGVPGIHERPIIQSRPGPDRCYRSGTVTR